MAGMTNRSSLRDSIGVSSMVEDTIVPELDAWAKSPDRGGSVDGEKHAADARSSPVHHSCYR